MVWNDLGNLLLQKTCFTQLISQFQRYFPALGKHALVVFAHTDNIQFSFWCYFCQKEGVRMVISVMISRRPANIRMDMTHLPVGGRKS